MTNMLPLVPMGEVRMPGSAPDWPWNVQEMDRGSSPFIAMQDSWAKSPWSTTSLPNVKGTSCGATAKERERN